MKNTTLVDIVAVVGLMAANELAAWYGGDNMYVPHTADEDQVISRLIGVDKARLLSEAWPGEWVWVPSFVDYERAVLRKTVWTCTTRGMTPREIARMVRVGPRRVEQIVQELETRGLLDPVTRLKNARGKRPAEKPPAKMRSKKAVCEPG